jgi:hypothetical protein
MTKPKPGGDMHDDDDDESRDPIDAALMLARGRKGYADAGAVVLRGRAKAPTRSMSATERQPTIDHDDLLALLDRPRPAHGDLHMLLKRRSVMRGTE